MLRKRHFFGALVVFLALTFGGLPCVASASTNAGLNFTMTEDYSCLGPCATATYFSADGIAHSGSQSFGTMTDSETGQVLNLLPDGCYAQSENWAFTTQKGKNTFFLTTTSSTFCPTANPNIFLENNTFTITGGTGIFSNATGAGTFVLTARVHPQTSRGTLSGTITY
jgi:hypothetical protein